MTWKYSATFQALGRAKRPREEEAYGERVLALGGAETPPFF